MPPPVLSPLAALGILIISIILCATMAAMVASWIWAIGRIRAGRRLLPEPKPRTVPWGTGSVLIVFLVWLGINLSISIGYMTLSGARGNHRSPTFTEQMALVSFINGVLLLVIPAILHLTSGATLADLGIDRRGLTRQAFAGTLGFLMIAPFVYALNGLAVLIWRQNQHPLQQMVLSEPSAGIACLALLSAVVFAPAAEELIFRGIIQSWLAQLLRRPDVTEDFALDADLTSSSMALEPSTPGWGHLEEETDSRADPTVTPRSPRDDVPPIGPRPTSAAAIVITSAVFAAVHLPQWPAPVAIFLLSVGLGTIYQRTGSLLASMLMHALFNGLSTMLLFTAVLIGLPDGAKVPPNAFNSPVEPRTTGAEGPPGLRPSDIGERKPRNRDFEGGFQLARVAAAVRLALVPRPIFARAWSSPPQP